MQPCEGHKQPLGVVPPLTQFLCSRCPSLPEILLIGFFCSVRWDGLCGVESSFAKTGSPAASPRDCWDPFFKFPKRFPSSVPCFWSQVASVPSSVTVLASNCAIPGNCSQIIRRQVLQWQKISMFALVYSFGKLHVNFNVYWNISVTLYTSFLGTSKSVRNLQCI